MSWFTEPSPPVRKQWRLCACFHCLPLSCPCTIPLFQSRLPRNKLGGGISLTEWGPGVATGPIIAIPVFLPSAAPPQWLCKLQSLFWLQPTDPSCSPGPTPAPAMPPPSGCRTIKSSSDSSELLSRASIPWVLGPPYRRCLCLASCLRALPWLPGWLSGLLSPKLSVCPFITAGC